MTLIKAYSDYFAELISKAGTNQEIKSGPKLKDFDPNFAY